MSEDYYATLGVARDASQTDIQKAYRDLARKYHPDLNPDDDSAKTKFQNVQKAFDVLNDTSKREMYDRYGASFEQMGAGGGQGHPGTWSSAGINEDMDFADFFNERFGDDAGGGFADIFSQFRRSSGRSKRSGRSKGPSAPAHGQDVQHETTIPFRTAIEGGQIQFAVPKADGSHHTIAVTIPTGIEDGKKIRLKGQGLPGPGGASPGDLYLRVHVAPHACFQRRGNDLHLRVPITVAEAIRGAKIDVPTPTGTVTLTVPPRTSSGAKLRIRGHGVPSAKGRSGDLYSELLIVIPRELSDTTIENLAASLDELSTNPRGELAW